MARILVIEDNPDNLELMTFLLRAFGHQTVTADNGETGLAAVRRDLPDLVVCDVHLPCMDGYEVAGQMKRDPDLCRIPLVAVTALAMVGDRDRVLAAGFDGYIAKPIEPEKFVGEVMSYLPGAESVGAPPAPPTASVSAPPPDRTGAFPAIPAKLSVLVVDDVFNNRKLLAHVLTALGCEVCLATNADEAMCQAERHPPGLILSDLHLPGQDGFAFIRRVKATPALAHIPFMFISASLWGNQDRATGLALGADRFVLRPIEPDALMNEIAACLSAHREKAHGNHPGR